MDIIKIGDIVVHNNTKCCYSIVTEVINLAIKGKINSLIKVKGGHLNPKYYYPASSFHHASQTEMSKLLYDTNN